MDTGLKKVETPRWARRDWIVTDAEGMPIQRPDDEVPEADAAEQHQAADSDDDTGLDTAYLDAGIDRDANEADVIEQAFIVPSDDRDDADG